MSGADSWRDQAACKDHPTALFFARPGDNLAVAAAKAICAGCPVRAECLDLVLANEEGGGTYAGTTPIERRALRRQYRADRGEFWCRRVVAPCGTEGGAKRHRRNHETICDPCRVAYNQAAANRKTVRRDAERAA